MEMTKFDKNGLSIITIIYKQKMDEGLSFITKLQYLTIVVVLLAHKIYVTVMSRNFITLSLSSMACVSGLF